MCLFDLNGDGRISPEESMLEFLLFDELTRRKPGNGKAGRGRYEDKFVEDYEDEDECREAYGDD